LARLLCLRGYEVLLWGHCEEHLESIQRAGRNERLLPGVDLPRELRFEPNLAAAVGAADLILLAVPSSALRWVGSALRDFSGTVISVTKGIEFETGLTMTGILRETSPRAQLVAVSGPSFAAEVARDIPTAVVVASESDAAAEQVQGLLGTPAFRVYTSTDLLGVELGGALKNVIAIAAGCSDGLGFGDNAKAALVTRAIVELRRLAVACGGRPETLIGLSGLGDLVATCFSKLSRNRGFGERVGRGEKPEDILAGTCSVVEGYPTTRSAVQLARAHKVSTPVIDEVYAMLYQGKNIRAAVSDLMLREPKPESEVKQV
jgi:glycerol-3-phosphate dehydrogenase (NAD(P)+)